VRDATSRASSEPSMPAGNPGAVGRRDVNIRSSASVGARPLPATRARSSTVDRRSRPSAFAFAASAPRASFRLRRAVSPVARARERSRRRAVREEYWPPPRASAARTRPTSRARRSSSTPRARRTTSCTKRSAAA
jgi:hypothetical protein